MNRQVAALIASLLAVSSIVINSPRLTQFYSFFSDADPSLASSQNITSNSSLLLLATNNVLEAVPACHRCEDDSNVSRTCSKIFAQDPNLARDCIQRPNLEKCNLKCADYPEPENKTIDDENHLCEDRHPTFWPPLDRGQWVDDPVYCARFQASPQACVLGKYRWKLSACDQFETFDRQSACSLLWEHNISDILVAGDSLMRNLWHSLILVLSGDSEFDVNGDEACRGATGFAQRRCRAGDGAMFPLCFQNSTETTIQVKYLSAKPYGPPPLIEPVPNRGKTLHLYGIGNHPLNGKTRPAGRLSILNPEMYYDYFNYWNLTMPYFWGRDGHHLLWIPPHYKLSIGRTDESNERGLNFMQKTHEYFSLANHTGTVNTFSLTKRALRFFCRRCEDSNCEFLARETCNVTTETHDGYHFGPAINAWKVHLVLHHFQKSLSRIG